MSETVLRYNAGGSPCSGIRRQELRKCCLQPEKTYGKPPSPYFGYAAAQQSPLAGVSLITCINAKAAYRASRSRLASLHTNRPPASSSLSMLSISYDILLFPIMYDGSFACDIMLEIIKDLPPGAYE